MILSVLASKMPRTLASVRFDVMMSESTVWYPAQLVDIARLDAQVLERADRRRNLLRRLLLLRRHRRATLN